MTTSEHLDVYSWRDGCFNIERACILPSRGRPALEHVWTLPVCCIWDVLSLKRANIWLLSIKDISLICLSPWIECCIKSPLLFLTGYLTNCFEVFAQQSMQSFLSIKRLPTKEAYLCIWQSVTRHLFQKNWRCPSLCFLHFIRSSKAKKSTKLKHTNNGRGRSKHK